MRSLILALMLTACSVATPRLLHECPHPFEELRTSYQLVRSITVLPYYELQDKAAEYGYSNVWGLTVYPGTVYISAGLSDKGYEKVVEHEVCHIHRRELGLGAGHEGWL